MKRPTAKLLFWLMLIPCWLTAQSNIELGTWRTHFSYQNAKLLAIAKEQAYVASQNGLFVYNFSEETLTILSKLDGLSDVGISAISYQESSELLIIAYRSGIVDVLSGSELNTFELLAEGNELINAIQNDGERIYLATSEGIRVLHVNPESREINILESYTQLGEEGEKLAIFDVALLGDSIFLATDAGILSNSLATNVNRQDFRSWQRFGSEEGLPALPVRHLAAQAVAVYGAVDGVGVFIYKNNEWQLSRLQTEARFNSLRASDQGVVASTSEQVWVLNETLQTIDLSAPQDAAFAENGTLWVADNIKGLVRILDGQQVSFYPNGPLSDEVYSIHAVGDKIISLQEDQAAFSVFDAGRWTNYDSTYLTAALNTQQLMPLTDADFLPADDHFYFGSAGSGLLRWDGEENFNLIAAGEGNSMVNNQISALSVDENLLWVTNYASASPLHRYEAISDNWVAYNLTDADARLPLDISLVNAKPWLLSGPGGARDKTASKLLAFEPESGNVEAIRTLVAPGNLPGSIFTELIEDLDGEAWLTGNEGISYFPVPSEVFTSSPPTVIKPIFENQFLLFGEYISALAIDGGNRKWVGTREGIWLFGENTETLVSRFTADNSPLPSDNIFDITIDNRSGEVFILTDRGLVSYRGTASEGQPVHQNVKIFPNPVPYNFSGLVGIEGLVSDAIVKVTTISGRLVKELRAEGSTAVWDVSDYNGSRVATGVYLVFSASADGSETFVGKIAVIN